MDHVSPGASSGIGAVQAISVVSDNVAYAGKPAPTIVDKAQVNGATGATGKITITTRSRIRIDHVVIPKGSAVALSAR